MISKTHEVFYDVIMKILLIKIRSFLLFDRNFIFIKLFKKRRLEFIFMYKSWNKLIIAPSDPAV